MTQFTAKIVIDGQNRAGPAFRSTKAGLASISEQLARTKRELVGFFAGREALRLAGDLISVADAYKQVDARLKLATRSTQEYVRAQNDLFVIAHDTRGEFGDTVNLYARLARSTRELRTSQDQLLQVTKTINQTVALSGAPIESARAALFQLGQGLASGALRGEELNSVLEQTPRLAEAIAAGMGITSGELRALGTEGQITAEAIVQALLKQGEAVDREFRALPMTVGQALTQVSSAFTRYIGQVDRGIGTTGALAATISAAAEHFDVLADTVLATGAVIGTVLAGRGVAAATSAAAQMIAATRTQIAVNKAHGAALVEHRALQLADAQATLQAARAQAARTAAAVAEFEAERALLAEMAIYGPARARVEQQLTAARAAHTAATAGLAAAEGAATRAAAAHTAALTGQGVAARALAGTLGVLRGGLALLGGPIGAITTLLTLGAAAWLTWGNSAKSGVEKTRNEIADIEARIAALRQQEAFGTGQLGAARAQLDEAERRLAVLLGGPTSPQVLEAQRKKIERLKEEIRLLEEAEQKGTSPTAPSAAARAKLAIAQAEAETRIVTDSLQRQQRALEAAHAQGLISYRDYYAKRTALQQAEVDAEIRLTRAALDAARAALAQKTKEEDRLPIMARIKALETDLLLLARQRADIGAQGARDQLTAERELAAELEGMRARLLEAEGKGAEARLAGLEREFNAFMQKFGANLDAEGVAIVEKLFNVEAARARLGDLQAQADLVLSRMATEEQSIDVQREAGLLTETQARERIVNLHKQTSEEIRKLIPLMKQLAEASGDPAAIERVRQLEVELAKLGRTGDATARRINGAIEEGLVDGLVDVATHTKKAGDAWEDFGRRLRAVLARIAAEKLIGALLGGIGGGTGSSGGIGGILASVLHTGGIAGRAGTRRMISPLALVGAPRLHTGGLVAGEVAAVLRYDEEVLTPDNPRHIRNLGQGGIGGPLRVELHPDALNMTLRDWLERELARELATR